MSGLLLLGLLFFPLVEIIKSVKEPEMLTEIKRRYEIIRTSLPADARWERICSKCAIITGVDPSSGVVGSNVNKGYEIYICLDGEDIDSAMYVFLHELAHMTVSEYDHSTNFWNNFKDLRIVCQNIGVYSPVGAKKYCGKEVKD